ncbi:MAG: SDR family NAD(P)-dependent oxidoreductase, partial [Caldilinea sp.]|nr:SDR family NAD(P)-dependent oxidoreductase [Caldilinea sp.]
MATLAGKVAIVTGAAQGIGLGIAQALAQAGAAVVLADVNDAAGADVASALAGEGREACYLHADVTQESDVHGLI